VKPDLVDIGDHMKELGLGALTHAIGLSLYSDQNNPHWGDLSVLQAAHPAEILSKARIAAEHPLLIFGQIPRSSQAGGPLLAFEDLLGKGRTIDFQDLPERLWATTGQSISEPNVYEAFGRLRNAIQYFAPPAVNASARKLEFMFKVVDPFVFEKWGWTRSTSTKNSATITTIYSTLSSTGICGRDVRQRRQNTGRVQVFVQEATPRRGMRVGSQTRCEGSEDQLTTKEPSNRRLPPTAAGERPAAAETRRQADGWARG
jgi:hypothetical protein